MRNRCPPHGSCPRPVCTRKYPCLLKLKATPSVRTAFVAHLDIIVSVPGDYQRMHANQADALRRFRVEVDLAVEESRGEAGAVVEGGVRLEVAVVVLHLRRKEHPPRVVAIRCLRTGATRRLARIRSLREQRRRGHGLRRARFPGEIGADDLVPPVLDRGVGHECPDVVRITESIGGAADREQLVRAVRTRPVAALWRLVGGRQHAERQVAGRAGDLRAPRRIDDAPRVDGAAHVVVAARAGHAEQTKPLHEEGSLFGEERGKPLVHLHLERVALDLAEVGVDGRIRGHLRGQAVLHAQTQLRGVRPPRPTRPAPSVPVPSATSRSGAVRSRRRGVRSSNTSCACRSKTHCPGGMSGHE